ncbi:hypothetical protein FKP32DRAFT_726318 [Trametes sanguinea]|nr:hypothetical protein FKP32DRAFT_726318 [Trametes sanguinea]
MACDTFCGPRVDSNGYVSFPSLLWHVWCAEVHCMADTSPIATLSEVARARTYDASSSKPQIHEAALVLLDPEEPSERRRGTSPRRAAFGKSERKLTNAEEILRLCVCGSDSQVRVRTRERLHVLACVAESRSLKKHGSRRPLVTKWKHPLPPSPHPSRTSRQRWAATTIARPASIVGVSGNLRMNVLARCATVKGARQH